MQNVSKSPIYLKKGVQVTRLVPATPVLPSMPVLVSEGATALETIAEPLSMAEQQAKLLEKLDLSGLKNWAPRNAEATEQLVLSYHNVFALEKNELGCTSTVEHEIHIVDSEPFKERFRRIPPPLLEEVRASLRDMLDAGTIHPSQSPWCNAVMLIRKRTVLCASAWILGNSMLGPRRTHILYLGSRRLWRVWPVPLTFLRWTLGLGFGK